MVHRSWLSTPANSKNSRFQVRKNGEEDSKFWQKQTAHIKKTLNRLNKRAASLKDRSLCVKAKLQSLVMYHAHLCPSTKQEQENIDRIAWSGQWKGKVALKPSRMVGSLPWLQGGSNFAKIEWSIESSMAMWGALLVQGNQHIWAKEGRALIKKSFPEGLWALVRQPLALPRKSLGPRWSRIIQAWWKMNPKTEGPNHSEGILAWPVMLKEVKWSRYHPIVHDRVMFDKKIGKWRLRTPEKLSCKTITSKAQAVKKLAALRTGKAWEADKIGLTLQQLPKPLPKPSRLAKPLNITLADLSIDLVVSRTLRN